MKRTFICLLAAFALTTAGAAAAQPSPTEITASGTGSVSLPPNVATVNPSVETNAENANDAIAENNATLRSHRRRPREAWNRTRRYRADVLQRKLQSAAGRRCPQIQRGERYGYIVSRSFAVKVRKIGLAGRVSDACIAAGATAINGVSFGLSDSSAARAQAIAKAVAAARTNAETLARAAALRIVAIEEHRARQRRRGRPTRADGYGTSRRADTIRSIERQRDGIGQRRLLGGALKRWRRNPATVFFGRLS